MSTIEEIARRLTIPSIYVYSGNSWWPGGCALDLPVNKLGTQMRLVIKHGPLLYAATPIFFDALTEARQ